MSNKFYIVRKSEDVVHAKYIKREKVNGKWRYYYDYNDGKGWSNKVGVEVSKDKGGTTVKAFNTKADKYWRENQSTKTKNYGPLTVEQAEDGTTATLRIKKNKNVEKAKKKVAKFLGKSKKELSTKASKGNEWASKQIQTAKAKKVGKKAKKLVNKVGKSLSNVSLKK